MNNFFLFLGILIHISPTTTIIQRRKEELTEMLTITTITKGLVEETKDIVISLGNIMVVAGMTGQTMIMTTNL